MNILSRHSLGRAAVLGVLLWPFAIGAESVDELRAACVAEVRKGGAPVRSPSSACARYEDATLGTGPAAARPAPRSKPAKATPKPRSSKPRESRKEAVSVNDCDKFDYGSIAYRHCRADEKKRLTKLCQQLSTKADRANGKNRGALKASAAEHCQAARQYRIID